MIVLGLSFDYHDAAAALVIDGKVVAAAHEERFTRVKQDARLPVHAAKFCLAEAGITAQQVDRVVHYERPMLKFDRIVKTAARDRKKGKAFLHETMVDWFRDGKFDVTGRIQAALGIPASRVTFCDHHAAHAAAAFFCSPYDEAIIITLDGVGEHETATISVGRGTKIEKLASVNYPHSIGLYYSAFTAFLGFEVNEGEYKVMGMAGFGKPTHWEKALALFDLKPDGTFALNQDLFDFLMPEKYPFTPALTNWLGAQRKPETEFDPRGPAGDSVADTSRHYADIAASVQRATEEVMLHVVRQTMARTGIRNVCLAGGVALNSVANGRIVRELGADLYVQPAAGDAGSSLGAALHETHAVMNLPRRGALTTPYLGYQSNEAEIARTCAEFYLEPAMIFESDDALVAEVSRRLSEGAVIGWVQGRAEWGPRALGARSIIADPRRIEMQARVNEKIKFRELFRPFAPSVLAERASEFFEMKPVSSLAAPEHFMIAVAPVREDAKARIPAVTHVDGTARVHLVDRSVNPIYYDLIKALGDRTGVPVLLNTSFNLRGEPIVNTPADAIRTFQWSGMDALVLGRTLLVKEELIV